MLDRISVHKLDPQGNELWQYPAEVRQQDAAMIVLEARFDRGPVDVAGLALQPGDIFREAFYFDRWYNVFTVFDRETQALKGWYCNITRPAWLEGTRLYAEDLALDLVVLPDRRVVVLDQEEFDALNLPDEDRLRAQAALEELMRLARAGEGPFDLDPGLHSPPTFLA